MNCFLAISAAAYSTWARPKISLERSFVRSYESMMIAIKMFSKITMQKKEKKKNTATIRLEDPNESNSTSPTKTEYILTTV